MAVQQQFPPLKRTDLAAPMIFADDHWHRLWLQEWLLLAGGTAEVCPTLIFFTKDPDCHFSCSRLCYRVPEVPYVTREVFPHITRFSG